jgi:Cof subfamily protein (haloacid dehalogenase superfamily)
MAWLKRFNITIPFVAAGGAFIADPISGHIIFRDHLERALVEPAVKFAREAGVCILFEEPEQMLAEGDAVKLAALAENTQAPLTIVSDILADTGRTPPKIFLSGDHQALVAVETRIRQCHLPLHIAFSLPYFFEITRQGVDKGSALVKLAAHLGIPVERIAVIGDGDNDVSMFRVAGLAIAMGNASPAVQAEADLVAPTNDAGGAAWAIRKVIQKRLE